jgi:predicted DsbA family dithiol-disulfide isomerase
LTLYRQSLRQIAEETGLDRKKVRRYPPSQTAG